MAPFVGACRCGWDGARGRLRCGRARHRTSAARCARRAAARGARRLGVARAPPSCGAGARSRGAFRGSRGRAGRARACGARSVRSGGDRRRGSGELPRRAHGVGKLARLRRADETADHGAPAHHGLLRDDRRRPRLAGDRYRGRRDGRPRARVRRRVGAQPRPRPRYRPAHGRADEGASGRLGTRPCEPRARVRPRALGVLVRPARERGQRSDCVPRARRRGFLRHRLHALAQALHVAEHRDRRSRGRRAAARRLGRCDRAPRRSPRGSSS